MTWTPPSFEEERRLPFPGCAGRGVRIAVIDSGVHAAHPHIRAVAGGVTVGAGGSIEQGAFVDRLGHGTAVMAAIQEKAPEAEYFAVKIFDTTLRSTAKALFGAMAWAIAQRVDLVNLSLGTTNAAHADEFARLLALAEEGGTAVISAADAAGQVCFPGSLAGALGVACDEAGERHEYRVRGAAFAASGYPRAAPGIPRERNLSGISFAVANLTGFAARAMEATGARGLAQVREALIGGCRP